MEKFKICFLAFFIAGISNGFGQTTLYHNAQYSFDLKIPTGWITSEPGIVNNGQPLNIALLAHWNGAEEEAVEITVTVKDIWASLSQEDRSNTSRQELDAEYVETLKSATKTGKADQATKLSSRLNSGKLIEAENSNLDDTIAWHIEYSSLVPGFTNDNSLSMRISNTYILERNGIIFAVSASYPPEKEKDYAAITELCLKTFNVPLAYHMEPPFFTKVKNFVIDSVKQWVVGVIILLALSAIGGLLVLREMISDKIHAKRNKGSPALQNEREEDAKSSIVVQREQLIDESDEERQAEASRVKIAREKISKMPMWMLDYPIGEAPDTYEEHVRLQASTEEASSLKEAARVVPTKPFDIEKEVEKDKAAKKAIYDAASDLAISNEFENIPAVAHARKKLQDAIADQAWQDDKVIYIARSLESAITELTENLESAKKEAQILAKDLREPTNG